MASCSRFDPTVHTLLHETCTPAMMISSCPFLTLLLLYGFHKPHNVICLQSPSSIIDASTKNNTYHQKSRHRKLSKPYLYHLSSIRENRSYSRDGCSDVATIDNFCRINCSTQSICRNQLPSRQQQMQCCRKPIFVPESRRT